MITVTYTCLICHSEVKAEFFKKDLNEVEFQVNEAELVIASGGAHCSACGQRAPVRVTIFDDLLGEKLSEKIISPYHYGNTYFHTGTMGSDEDCPLCSGLGQLEVGLNAHKKEDLIFIQPEVCPMCEGKGYISKGE